MSSSILPARTSGHRVAQRVDHYEGLTSLDSDDVVKMESQVADGTRRRIDIEAGHVVIKVKKDLRAGNLADYEGQLAGYVQQRHIELGSRYVGILTGRHRVAALQPEGRSARRCLRART